MKCHLRPMHAKNMKHVNVKSATPPPPQSPLPFSLLFSFFSLAVPRCVRHKSSRWRWKPAVRSSSGLSGTERLMLPVESYSCFQTVSHSEGCASRSAAAPTNRETVPRIDLWRRHNECTAATPLCLWEKYDFFCRPKNTACGAASLTGDLTRLVFFN